MTYFPYPNSLDPLTPTLRKGLIGVGVCAMLSLISTVILLGFITQRLVSWRKHYKEYVGYNQYVVLIYNLLLADLQQAIAFSISWNWLRWDKIIAPTAPCFIQGWFLHIGDVSSGLFVLAIAIHTWLGVIKGYKMPYNTFVACIVGLWMFALLLTVLGPIMHRDHYFTRAGGWCWVSQDYEDERLYLHYLWIFIVEFGTILIYGHVFIHLRGRLSTIVRTDTSKLSRATKFMVLYPFAYLILTLPIAVARMVAMSGKVLPDTLLCVVGALLTSCGWADALLYTLTRRVLVTGQLSTNPYTHTRSVTRGHNPARPGDDYGMISMVGRQESPPTQKSEYGAAHSVTITGGQNRISRIIDTRHTRTAPGNKKGAIVTSRHTRASSPSGSTDSIINYPGPNEIGIVTETNIQYEVETESQRPSGDLPHATVSEAESPNQTKVEPATHP